MSEVVAMDVEMVGTGPNGSVSVPARVAVVNSNCLVLYDTYIKPRFPVTDYRPAYNGGISARQLARGVSFDDARERLNSLIKDCILVGHDLKFDLEVFELTHNNTRDTAAYPPFVESFGVGHKPNLKVLAEKILNRKMFAPHDPVEDARVAMEIYMKYQW